MTRARGLALFAALMLLGSVAFAGKHSSDLSKIVEKDDVDSSRSKKSSCSIDKKKRSKKVSRIESKRSRSKSRSHSRSKVHLRSAAKVTVRSHVAKPAPTPNIYFKNGNSEFAIGGDAKIENYYLKNAFMLNDKLPDENYYFKHTLDLNFDYVFGKEKFNHKAVEAYLNLRHSAVWGRAQSYADRNSATSDAAGVQIADASTGTHTHYSGRSLPWISEAWLQTSFNAMLGLKNENVHSIKLGWFPFDLGRGIALGRWYGKNSEVFGLYTYDKDDKWLPGINITGQLIKDKLSYDLYFAKMEENSKSLSDNIDLVRVNWLNQSGIPWRGVHKDNDIYAARLKWKAFKNDCYGTLDVEPYIMYNNGLDQWIESDPDEKFQFGAYGLGAEYAWKNFEFGTEVAANYGSEKVVAFDRNKIVLKRDATTGAVTEYYDHIVTGNPVGGVYRVAPGYTSPDLAKVDANGKAAYDRAKALNHNASNNGALIGNFGGTDYYNDGVTAAAADNIKYNTPTVANRFRPAYTNKLHGWMFVTDAAYKLPDYNLKFAIAYNYASGDANPHENEVNKTYKGFIGVNEGYFGKRVPSIFLLDERFLKVPTALTRNSDELVADVSFTDIHVLGAGATWTPTVGGKKVSLNPNMLFFWKDSTSKKVIVGTGVNGWSASTTENASKYMGSELNVVAECEMLKDLKVFGRFASFIPGSYFTDVAGVPLDDDFFAKAYKVNPNYNAKDFRLGHDTAYYADFGLSYKF